MLLGELDARRARYKRKEKLGIVAKIETARAVCNLPEIIVRAAGRGPFGVMIARGDLAVEVGYLRVAELQEDRPRLAAMSTAMRGEARPDAAAAIAAELLRLAA